MMVSLFSKEIRILIIVMTTMKTLAKTTSFSSSLNNIMYPPSCFIVTPKILPHSSFNNNNNKKKKVLRYPSSSLLATTTKVPSSSSSSSVLFQSLGINNNNDDDDASEHDNSDDANNSSSSNNNKPLFDSFLKNKHRQQQQQKSKNNSIQNNNNIHQNNENYKRTQPPPPLFDSFINSGTRQHISNNNHNNNNNDSKTKLDNNDDFTVKKDYEEEEEEEALIRKAFQQTHENLLRPKTTKTTSSPSDLLYKDESIQSINHAIVQQGLFYQQKQQKQRVYKHQNGILITPKKQKVPGCVATVYLRTILIPLTTATAEREEEQQQKKKKKAKNYKVALEGTADALLSRGLLALLSQSLSSSSFSCGTNETTAETAKNAITAETILKVQPEKVSDYLKLRNVLSVGRNDGLKSMMMVVQSQIRELLMMSSSSSLDDDDDMETEDGIDDGDGGEDVVIQQPQQQQHEKTTPINTSSEEEEVKQQQQEKPKVAMLLSGGVDSSVALNLLLHSSQQYNVTAFYLKIWLEDELSHLGQCPWEDDYAVCQQVCAQAGVPLETLSLQQEYKDRVITYTIEEAKKGRTPNPDVMCNSWIKFGVFYEEIVKNKNKKKNEGGFDFIASGHYAQLADDDTEFYEEKNEEGEITARKKMKRLLRAPDPIKDQSYFLSALTQEQLQHIIFPIGQYHKSDVRELASEAHFDLPNQNRPDSQGLCFLGKVKFDDFLSSYLGTNPGNIVDAATGDVIGEHQGLWFHTIGQRKGIGKVLYPKISNLGPWYIVAKDPQRNVIYASNQYEEEDFLAARTDFFVEDISWISGHAPHDLKRNDDDGGGGGADNNNADGGNEKEDRGGKEQLWKEGRFDMKIRHGPTIVQGTLRLTDGTDGISGNIHLDKKDGGLAPGQFVAFYTLNGNECLGSGVISERHWANFLMNSEAALSSVG